MIKDLEARQGNVELTADVVEVGEPREFTKFGRTGKVATAKLKDETGEVNLSLWNEQVDMVKPGSKVKITNGYVNEFQGEKQLTTGKFGKLEVLEQGDVQAEPASSEPEQPSEESASVEEEKVE